MGQQESVGVGVTVSGQIGGRSAVVTRASAVTVSSRMGVVPTIDPMRTNGLVLIITNDYKGSGLNPLSGTHNDGENIKKTMEFFDYAVLHEKNVSRRQMESLLLLAANGFEYLERFKCIMFYFSGHGGSQMVGNVEKPNELAFNMIYTQDGQEFPVEDIIDPFMPKNKPKCGNIPKVFFIDACVGVHRQYDDSELVPAERMVGGAVPKLQYVPMFRVPAVGNFIVACATSVGYVSWEANGFGVWTSALTKVIKEKAKKESVTNILTEVTRNLMTFYHQNKENEELMTQPYFVCKLQDTLYLSPKMLYRDYLIL